MLNGVNMPDDQNAPPILPRADGSGPDNVSDKAALAQLRAYIADRAFQPGERLPAERILCLDLGLTRAELRRALATLEAENRLWRHVGKGTFLTEAPPAAPTGDFDRLSHQVSPADVMRARAVLEPAIAREAALYASAAAIAKLRLNIERARRAASWREYEALDNDFHRLIAESSGSVTLLALFDQLNTLRRMVSWGRVVRAGACPPPDHSSFAEHADIVAEIAGRSPDMAQAAMRGHLRSVAARLMG
jgi:DNA-binding FadR family transcriptional regulator